MKYSTTIIVDADPHQVFAAIHEYKVARKPNEFFSWALLGTLVRMDYRVVTEHTLALDAVYDWKLSIMGVPFFSFREKVVEWQEGRKVAYQAVSRWKMFFTIDLVPVHEGTLVAVQIDFQSGPPILYPVERPFVEWRLRQVCGRLIRRGLSSIHLRSEATTRPGIRGNT